MLRDVHWCEELCIGRTALRDVHWQGRSLQSCRDMHWWGTKSLLNKCIGLELCALVGEKLRASLRVGKKLRK